MKTIRDEDYLTKIIWITIAMFSLSFFVNLIFDNRVAGAFLIGAGVYGLLRQFAKLE